MTDTEIRSRIEQLEDEERRLRADESAAAAAGRDDRLDHDRVRLAEIATELTGLWARLRQNQGLRDAGENPDGGG